MDNERLLLLVVLGCCCLLATVIPGAAGDDQTGSDPYYPVPRRVGLFGEGQPLYGIYRFKNKCYTIRNQASNIEVYDAQGLNDRLANLNAGGSVKLPYYLVGGSDCRSIFIADFADKRNITTVSTKSQNQVNYFPCGEHDESISLSTTKQPSTSDLAVTYFESQTVKEYTKMGSLVKKVTLDVAQPLHTIKLSSGGYAVCHGYSNDQDHRVCLLDDNGKVLDCFGSTKGSGQDQLDVCANVAEDVDGNLLVADSNNQRVILLINKGGKLTFGRELVTKKDGLTGPSRILSYGPLLYIADNTLDVNGVGVSGRILVFRVRDGAV